MNLTADQIETLKHTSVTVDLAKLRDLEKRATPGPWVEGMRKKGGFASNLPDGHMPIALTAPGQGVFYNCLDPNHSGASYPSADGELIAAVRNALPELLDELERLRAVTVSLGPMKPLGAEFEAVWDEHTDKLHEP